MGDRDHGAIFSQQNIHVASLVLREYFRYAQLLLICSWSVCRWEESTSTGDESWLDFGRHWCPAGLLSALIVAWSEGCVVRVLLSLSQVLGVLACRGL